MKNIFSNMVLLFLVFDVIAFKSSLELNFYG